MLDEEKAKIRALTESYVAQAQEVVAVAQRRLDHERRDLEEQKRVLKQQQAEFESRSRVVERVNQVVLDGVVPLNIGGTVVQTSKQVLCSDKQSIFVPLLSGQFVVEKDENGNIFLDRDPVLFPFVLDYLRRLHVATHEAERYNILRRMVFPPQVDPLTLMAEAEYYGVESLVAALHKDSYRKCWGSNGTLMSTGTSSSKLSKDFPPLKAHSEYILCCLLWDEDRIFFGSADTSVSECDPRNLATPRHSTVAHTGFVTAMIKLDNNHFVTASRDCTIKLWRVPPRLIQGQGVGQPAYPIASLEQHTDFVFDLCVVTSSMAFGESVTLASSGNDKIVYFWDIPSEILDPKLGPQAQPTTASLQVLHAVPDRFYRSERMLPLKSLMFFAGFIYVVCEDVVLVIDPETCVKVNTLKGHKGVVRCLGACSQRRVVVTGGWDKTCRVWPLFESAPPPVTTETESDQQRVATVNTPPIFAPPAVIDGHSSWVSDVQVYGDYLVASADKSVYFYDLATYKCERKVNVDHDDLIRCFVLTPGDAGQPSVLYTGSFDCTARMIQAAHGSHVWDNEVA